MASDIPPEIKPATGQLQAFAMLPVAAVLDERLTHAEFRALAAIAVHRNSRTGWSFPSHAAIAADLGLKPNSASEERVRQLLRSSVDAGYLERVAGSGRTKSRYRLVYDRPNSTEHEMMEAAPLVLEGAAPLVLVGPAPLAAKGCTKGYNQRIVPEDKDELRSCRNHGQPSQNVDSFPCKHSSTGDHGFEGKASPQRPASAQAEQKAPLPPARATTPAKRGGRQIEETPGFLKFWQLYPRKRDGRGKALPAWHKAITQAPEAEIIAGLRLFAFGADPQYHPMPATWLNGRAWIIEADTQPPTVIVPDNQPSGNGGGLMGAVRRMVDMEEFS